MVLGARRSSSPLSAPVLPMSDYRASSDRVLDAQGSIINNLTIGAVLTIGAGGKIIDADGSFWDQNGMVFRATGAVADSLKFTRDGFVPDIEFFTQITGTTGYIQIRANSDFKATSEHDARLTVLASSAAGGSEILAGVSGLAGNASGMDVGTVYGVRLNTTVSSASVARVTVYKDVGLGGLVILHKAGAGGVGTVTIATGVIAVGESHVKVDTESAAATDDLDTINAASGLTLSEGMILVLRAANGARTVVCKDGTGNLRLAGDMSLDNAEDTIALIYDGTNWLELTRSNNGA